MACGGLPGRASRGLGAARAKEPCISLIVFLMALLFFSSTLASHFSPDEMGYLAWGTSIYKNGRYETPDGRPVTQVPPLHPHLIGWAFRTLGHSVESAQAVSVAFAAACVWVTYLFGRAFFTRRAGLLAALLLATSARGEFWQYATRILNDVHLTFFLILTIFFLALHWRDGRWWTAILGGLSMGLGILTKELAILALPLLIPAMLLRSDPPRRRFFHLFLALVFAAAVVLPWLGHVNEVTGSPLGGVAKRTKGDIEEVIWDRSNWGVPDARSVWHNLHFRGMTSGPFKVLYSAAFIYAIYRFLKRRARGEWLLLMFVATWLCVFIFFLWMDPNRRRFVVLLPMYNVLVAVLIDDIYSRRKWFSEKLRMKGEWLRIVGGGLLLLLLVVNLWPQKWLSEVRPLGIFRKSHDFLLQQEANRAIRCLLPGAAVVSNYPNLFYFYGAGQHAVFKSRLVGLATGHRRGEQRKDPGGSVSPRRRADRPGLMEVMRSAGIRHVVVFLGKQESGLYNDIERLRREGALDFTVRCQEERFVVYDLMYRPPCEGMSRLERG